MQSTGQRQWSFVLGGICLMIIGFIFLFAPGLTLVIIATVAGIGLVVAGVIDIISYFQNRERLGLTGWSLAYGIGDIIIGLIFVIHPLITSVVIPWLVGIFVFAYGIFSIVVAWSLRGVKGAGWAWFNAIFSLICGASFFLWPEIFAYFIAFFLIFRGVALAVYGASGNGVPPTPTYSRYRS